MKRVTVYFFEKYDIKTDQSVRSERPATLEAITRANGQAIMATALEIEETELDGNGFREEQS